MNTLLILRRLAICLVLTVCMSASASAGLTLRFDQNDLSEFGPGPKVFAVDVFLNWDGSGLDRLIALNFDLTMPAEVTLPDGTPSNPLGFDFADINANSVLFENAISDISPLSVGDNLLTTLAFEVNAAFGDFPVDVTLVDARHGNTFQDASGEFTSVSGGVLSLSAVPEPSSIAVLGVLSATGMLVRRRRRTPR